MSASEVTSTCERHENNVDVVVRPVCDNRVCDEVQAWGCGVGGVDEDDGEKRGS